MPAKTTTAPATPPLPPGLDEAIRKIVREIVTTENDIELTIPDEEIERVAVKSITAALAPLVARIEAIERELPILREGALNATIRRTEQAEAAAPAAVRVAVKPKASAGAQPGPAGKPARVDLLRTRLEAINERTRKERAE